MKPPSLWLPFGALGVAGGWLVSRALGAGDPPVGALLVSFTPISCMLLGGFLEKRIGRFWLPVTFVATIVAGVFNGAIIGLCLAGPVGVPFGGMFGAMYSLPFLPATLAVAYASRRVKAAPETPVGRAQRRGVWATAAFSIAAAAALTASGWHRSLGWAPVLLALAGATIGGLMLARDVGELLTLRRVASRVRGMTLRTGPLPKLVDLGAQRIDLGAGDAVFDEVEPGDPYRGVDRLLRTVHGDPTAALRAVGFSLARDAALVLMAGIAAFATVSIATTTLTTPLY
jgi:hypothetical protein